MKPLEALGKEHGSDTSSSAESSDEDEDEVISAAAAKAALKRAVQKQLEKQKEMQKEQCIATWQAMTEEARDNYMNALLLRDSPSEIKIRSMLQHSRSATLY